MKIDYYQNMFAGMKALRSNFENLWIDIDKYFYGITGSYDSNPMKGQLSYTTVYDQTAFNVNVDATNALVGILWQQGGRSIKLIPAEELQGDTEAQEWLRKSTEKFVRVLDDRNAKLMTSLIQYMSGALSHGSAGVGVFRSTNSALVFKPYPVRTMYYQENDEGLVDTIAIRTWKPAYQIVQKYGEENVSEAVRKQAKSPTERNTEVEVIQFIMPSGDADKPYSSVHVDMSNEHIVKDSYYEDLPIKVGRIYKNSFETYGRSPAVNNIMTVKRLNAIVGDLDEGIEQTIRPPKGVVGDAMLGNGVIDLSANAVNQFNSAGSEGTPPIFPINTVGDLNPAFQRAEQMRNDLREAYHINKLIDMNNDAQMTATEAVILDRIRNTSLGALLANQINEVFTPLVETSFNLLFNDGYFGYIEGSEQLSIERTKMALEGSLDEPEVIPEGVAKLYAEGKEIYKVEYLTPAARMLKAEEANNIIETANAVGVMAQILGVEALDNVNRDEMIRDFYALKGLDDKLELEDDIEERRAERAAIQEQQAQAEMMQKMGAVNAG